MSWRVPVLNHRCCFCADVPPLNMRALLLRHPGPVQFMNNDYVGEQKGRCGNFGYDKNEVRRARPTSDVLARVNSSCAWLLAPDSI